MLPLSVSLSFCPSTFDDLSTVKSSADTFKRSGSRLDVLFNNAGVSLPPVGSVSKQGYELQFATNCLGPLLFTQLLLPSLRAAAQITPPGTVRIVWTSSQVVEFNAPKGDLRVSDLASPPSTDQAKNYVTSKLGNWSLASKLTANIGSQGILSVVQNPGNLKTNLLRSAPKLMVIAAYPLLHKAKQGA